MRKLLLVIFFTAMGMVEGQSQTLIQTYTDRCTGATTVFSVPLNGSTVVTFYNKSRNVSAQDIYNGTFQAWLEETYQWWAALSPCSTAQNEATNTTQQTQQTAQAATTAAANAASTNVPDTSNVADTTSNVPQQNSNPPDTNQTATTNDTQNNSTDQSQSNQASTEDTTSSSNESSGDTDTQTSDQGSESDDSQSNNDSGSESTDNDATTEEQSTEEDTQSTGDDSNSSEEEESDSNPVEEESKEEESKEEESTEKESTEEEKEEETKEEEKEEETKEEEPEEEEKTSEKKKKKKRNLAPPVVSANVLSQQDLLGNYTQALSFGLSRSSLTGDKTYSSNLMVWSNLKQFMFGLGFSKVFMNKQNRVEWVYSTNLAVSRMFKNTSANWTHSIVHLGKKGSVAGLAVSANSLWTSFSSKAGSAINDYKGILVS